MGNLTVVLNNKRHLVHIGKSLERLIESLVKDDTIDSIYHEFFQDTNKVPDVSRYDVLIENQIVQPLIKHDCSDFPCSHYNDQNTDSVERSIVVILESPHKFEYCITSKQIHPIAPAQGTTGRSLEEYLVTHISQVVEKNPQLNGLYSVVLLNPIQWQTSLAMFMKNSKSLHNELRDKIWKTLWTCPDVQDDFIDRLSSVKPELVVNACTGKYCKYGNITDLSGINRKDWPIHYLVEEKIRNTKRDFLTTSVYHPSSKRNFKSTKYDYQY